MPASNDAVDQAISDLRGLVTWLPSEWAKWDEVEASAPRQDGGWSRKQIVGHLIDSASVNHQRFVRAGIEPVQTLLYSQAAWVDANAYVIRPWPEVLNLWRTLNQHLLCVLEEMPLETRALPCGVGDDVDWSVSFRIVDYVEHLNHHVHQIRDFVPVSGSQLAP